MKGLILRRTSDMLFIAFISFLLSFFIVSFFFSRPYSFVIAGTVTALSGLIAFKIMSEKEKRKAKKESQALLIKNTINQLCFEKEKDVIALFNNAFIKQNYKTEVKRNRIILPEKKLAVFFFFNFEGLNKTEVVKAFNYLDKGYRAVIFTSDIKEDVKDFIIRFDGRVNALYGKEVFDILEDTELLPQIKYTLLTEPPKKKIKLKNFFEKKKAKGYFVFGVTFLLLSLFVPLKIYYVVSGCILLILSVLCKFLGVTENNGKF